MPPSQSALLLLWKVPLLVLHCGYRCPNPHCQATGRSYRSAEADRLTLPGFTFGLDIVILVGHLRLAKHLTLDEVHHYLQEQLTPQQLTISRREILYLFDAYCSLLRAASEPSEDPEFQAWRAKAQANGGVIISIDGIQPRYQAMKRSIWSAMSSRAVCCVPPMSVRAKLR